MSGTKQALKQLRGAPPGRARGRGRHGHLPGEPAGVVDHRARPIPVNGGYTPGALMARARPPTRRYDSEHDGDGRRRPRRARRARVPGRRGPRHRDLPRAARCSARCCSRARPASARPRWPRCWRAGPAASWCGSSATRASTPPRPSTSGTTRASCSTCGRSRRAAEQVVEDELYSERFLVRRPLLRAIGYEADALGRVAAGAARRRGRPRRRRVRGVPARDPLRLHGHGARARHVPRDGAAGRGGHVEPHPRRARRARSAVASTTGSSIPTSSASSRSCACARPRCPRRWRVRSRPRSRRSASSSSTSRPVSPRRSTGRNALAALGSTRPRRAHRRRHARHDPQVPRRPGAHARRTACGELVARARGGAQCLSVERRPDRGRVRAGCCAAPGSTCRVGTTVAVRARRSRRSGSARRDRRVLGRPGHARPPARGRRRLRPRVHARSGTATRRGRPRAPPSTASSTLAFDAARRGRRRRRRRRATAPTTPDARGALQPGRGAAPPRLRRVHARRSSPRRGG